MNPHYPAVARRAAHRCEYCHAPEVIFNFPFEVEHITPTSRQGDDDEPNLCLACRSCNLFKAVQTTATDDTTGTEVALFHPRRDCWEDHFRLDTETGEIQALTPMGRVTVRCLRMNNPVQTEARRLWIRLGLFA